MPSFILSLIQGEGCSEDLLQCTELISHGFLGLGVVFVVCDSFNVVITSLGYMALDYVIINE
jgi:hypothetical protein